KQPSPAVQHPAMGAVVSSLLAPKELALPGFIGVGGTAQRVGPGFLGMMYAPFTVQNPGQPPANIKAPAGLGGSPDETMERVHRRQRLFYAVEDEFNKNAFPHLAGTSSNPKEREKQEAALREAAGSPAQAHEAIYNKAFDLTVSPLRTVFEVSRE